MGKTAIKDLALLLILTVLVRLSWIFMVPAAEAPDEVTHFWVINFCANEMRLPSLADVISAGKFGVYGSIPQFGYVPHIVFLKLLPCTPQLISARLGSLSAELVSVITAYFIAKRLFAPDRLLTLSLPLMLVFHPQFVFVGSYANNDATTCAISSLILFFLTKMLADGFKLTHSLTIGILLGWIILSKYSSLCLVPTVFIALCLTTWLHRANVKSLFYNLAAVTMAPLIICPTWFWRNYCEFNGDISGALTMHKLWSSAYGKNIDTYRSPFEIVMQTRWWRMNFFSFWGWFGYMTRSLPRPFYYGYLTFVILAFLGAMKAGFTYLKATHSGSADQTSTSGDADIYNSRLRFVKPSIWIVFGLCALTNLAVSLAASSSGIGGPQGRYLFPSEIPLMALLLLGLSEFGGKSGRFLIWLLLIFNAFTYFYSCAYLYSLYGFPLP